MRTCKAMVLEAPESFRLREFPIGEVGPDQMLLKIEMTGICGSDILLYRGQHRFSSFPKILGHELVGTVAEAGDQAAAYYGVQVGDRVSVEPYLFCGRCHPCLTGDYESCVLKRSYGVAMGCADPPYLLGGYAEYMFVLPGSKVHKIASHVPPEAACMSSVLGNGVRWIRTRGQVRFGETVAIVGAGAQGIATLLAARAAGAGKVIIFGLGHDVERMAIARELGADHTVNIEETDPVEAIAALTDGRKADVVVEGAGAPQAVGLAVNLARRKGRVVLAGVNGGRQVSLATDVIVNNELTVLGGHGQTWDVEPAVQLINNGALPVHRLVTHRFPLERAEEAMRFFVGRQDPRAIRIALVPHS